MSRKNFSEEQIKYALMMTENGKPVRDVCRELGVREESFYTWKDGKLSVEFRRPYDMIVNTKKLHDMNNAAGDPPSGFYPIWRSVLDAFLIVHENNSRIHFSLLNEPDISAVCREVHK